MMKTKLITSLGIVASGLICLPFFSGSADPDQRKPIALSDGADDHPAEGDYDKPGTDPGWYEQWYSMRKNEDGLVPAGLVQNWRAHDEMLSASRAGTSFLTDVHEAGPFDIGGRTRALLIDYSNQNRYFAGAVSGGLWKSDNAGASWVSVTDDYPSLSVSCITQSPFDHNILYYGTGECASNTAGIPGAGIFKSTDGGETFAPLASTQNSTFEYSWCIRHSLAEPNDVFVGTLNKGLMISRDGGTTWSVFYSTTKSVNDIEIFPDGRVMFTVNGEGIFQAYYNGSVYGNILPVTNGLPANDFKRIELAYCQTQPNYIYAVLAQGNDTLKGVYRSGNGGLSWTAKTLPQVAPFKHTWYCFEIGVDPVDENKLFVAASGAAYSTNGGSVWNAFDGGHGDYHAHAFHLNNPDVFLVGNDGGVYRKNWSALANAPVDLNQGYHVTQFYAGNYLSGGNYAIGGTQDNGSYRLATSTWSFVNGGDGGNCAVSLQDPNLAYVTKQNGRIYRTEDFLNPGGPAFTKVNQNGDLDSIETNFIFPLEISRSDGNTLFTLTKFDLFRTTDKGADWTKISNNLEGKVLYALGVTSALNPDVYFGGSGIIKRLSNAKTANANSVVDLTASMPGIVASHTISSITPHPSDESIVYVTFSTISSHPRVYRVEQSNGNNPVWHAIAGDLPLKLPCNWIETDPDNDQYLMVATDYGLYCSEDGGTTWIKETVIPDVPVFQLRLRHKDKRLFVFTHGRGVWSASLAGGTAVNYSDLPYSTTFSELLDKYWTTQSSNPNGRIEINNVGGAYSGVSQLSMDAKQVGYVTNQADLHIDLSNHTSVVLKFQWKDMNDENHVEDGVFLSDDGGQTFVKAFDLTNGTYNTWTEKTLALSAFMWLNQMDYHSSKVVIRFQQRDNYPMISDGMAFDNVSVTGLEQYNYASLPYSTGFESGSKDQYWTFGSGSGRTRITGAFEPQGNQHLTMDVATSGFYSTNEAYLRLNLQNQSDVQLEFDWKEYQDETHANDGLYISDDGGQTFTKIFNLSGGSNGIWNHEQLDVSDLLIANNLAHTTQVVLKFVQYDNYSMPDDGIAIDNIEVYPGLGNISPEEPLLITDHTDASAAIALYPNPAKDYVYVSLKGLDGKVQGKLYASDGRYIKTLELSDKTSAIDITGLAQGTYLVAVEMNGNRLVSRFTKH